MNVFAESITRRFLFDGWRRRRQDIASIIAPDSEWVDGSFVSAKLDPKDLDVVTFIDGGKLEALPVEARQRLDAHFASRLGSQILYGSDSFLVAVRPPGHPLRGLFELMLNHYERLWGRSIDGVDKGFLDVRGEP